MVEKIAGVLAILFGVAILVGAVIMLLAALSGGVNAARLLLCLFVATAGAAGAAVGGYGIKWLTESAK